MEISTTKTEGTAKAATAFATLRFAGDALNPREISNILPEVQPWRSHRKGEVYYAGPRSGHLTGRTGVWYLSTDKLSDSPDLMEHLGIIARLLYPAPENNLRLMKIRDVLTASDARPHISLFWRGAAGQEPPAIPGKFAELAHMIGADIETDFERDD